MTYQASIASAYPSSSFQKMERNESNRRSVSSSKRRRRKETKRTNRSRIFRMNLVDHNTSKRVGFGGRRHEEMREGNQGKGRRERWLEGREETEGVELAIDSRLSRFRPLLA